jgi:outer membrane protein assembly factor BamB
MSLVRALVFVVLLSTPVQAVDWPQYRGPNRDDVSAEIGLLQQWPEGGPTLLWTYANTGIGYSPPAVVGRHLYTLGDRGEKEYLIALNLQPTGNGTVNEAWSVEIGVKFDWEGNRWSAGPSATPTVDGEYIFALSGMGDLVCADATTGKVCWRKNLPADLEAEVNPIGGGPKKLGWGFTWSPLVDGDRLICVPGGPKGTVAALDKRTGEVLWRSAEATDQAAYTSPMPAEIGGVRQYVVLTNQGLLGVGTDGTLLWRYDRRFSTEVINSPIVQGPLVYVTVGSGHGCELVRVTRDGGQFRAESVYANKSMSNHHGNVVLLKGHIFGASERIGWLCQAFDSGEILWSERGKVPPGSVTYADGRFYAYGEMDGSVHLIEASTAGLAIAGRFKIPRQSQSRKPGGHIWTPPVVSGGRLFLRDQELLFCYDVKAGSR